MNIVFQTPEGIAVTELGEATNSREHARFLLTISGFDGWLPVAYDRPAEFFPDKDFQAAWVWDGKALSIDLAKARVITADRLRFERDALYPAQDIAYQRAMETGADTSAIIAEKNRLRDVPKLVDTCKTLDELKALHA